jgi:hypothetical protein
VLAPLSVLLTLAVAEESWHGTAYFGGNAGFVVSRREPAAELEFVAGKRASRGGWAELGFEIVVSPAALGESARKAMEPLGDRPHYLYFGVGESGAVRLSRVWLVAEAGVVPFVLRSTREEDAFGFGYYGRAGIDVAAVDGCSFGLRAGWQHILGPWTPHVRGVQVMAAIRWFWLR